MGEGSDDRCDAAGGGHARRHPQPSSGFSEKTLQLFLDLGVRHLLQQSELKPLQHLLTLGEKPGHHCPNLLLRFRAKLDVNLVLKILPHRPEIRFQKAQRVLDLGLDFFFDLGFDLDPGNLSPIVPPEKIILSVCPKVSRSSKHFFAPLPAGIVSLFDFPDKSSDLPLCLFFSRVESAADRRQFLLIRFQHIQRTLQTRSQSARYNLRRLRDRTQFSTAFFTL